MKNKYLCTTPLVIDGVTICVPGKTYTIVDVVPGANEIPEDVFGYCDIYAEDSTPVAAATWLDVDEHFVTSVCGSCYLYKDSSDSSTFKCNGDLSASDCAMELQKYIRALKNGEEGKSEKNEPNGDNAPMFTTIRRFSPYIVTLDILKRAMEEGKLDKVLPVWTEIDVPMVDGSTVTAVCGYATPTMARLVFKDCLEECPMNYTATNKTGYYGSAGRDYVLNSILPMIALEWRELMAPRKLSEIIGGETVEYADLLWLPSTTDMIGSSNGRWWNDEPDSFQLEIFKRDRERIKEAGDKGAYCHWLRSFDASFDNIFCSVSCDGIVEISDASTYLGIAPGFDIAALASR